MSKIGLKTLLGRNNADMQALSVTRFRSKPYTSRVMHFFFSSNPVTMKNEQKDSERRRAYNVFFILLFVHFVLDVTAVYQDTAIRRTLGDNVIPYNKDP